MSSTSPGSGESTSTEPAVTTSDPRNSTTSTTVPPPVTTDTVLVTIPLDVDPESVQFPTIVRSGVPFVVSGPKCGHLVRVVVLRDAEPVFDSGRLEVDDSGWQVQPMVAGESGESVELRVVCDVRDYASMSLERQITIE